jgi:MYXO-CTERM domain-containing protein
MVFRNREAQVTRRMLFWLIIPLILALLASVAGTTGSVLAAVKGEPDLEAAVVGSHELTVGQVGALQIMVQNVGAFSGDVDDPADQAMATGYLTATGITLVPPCTTAIGITADLTFPSSSIEVLSGEASLGTLSRGMSTIQPINFQLYIHEDTEPGTYDLDLKFEYQYLKDVDWLNPGEVTPQFEFHWGNRVQEEQISIMVVGTYFSAVVTQTEGIRAGGTGVITADIQNSGASEAYDVTAEIVPGGSVSPIGQASFLGDMPGNSSATTQFKVAVSKEAIAKNSSVSILIEYKDDRDIPRQSLLPVGVSIEGKLDFEVQPVQVDGSLTPGSERVITIPIVNVGDYQAQDAIARINIVNPFAVAPFSTTDDTAYIGALEPDESGLAKFNIGVDSDALPKPYILEVQVEYWDSSGNSYISDTMRATVTVEEPSGLSTTAIILISIGGAVAIVLLLGALRRRRRRA